jgi:23S rRNA (cytosine1962-C5)-methyltransferase
LIKTVKLRPGRERSALQRHPWLFASAVNLPKESIEPGETVRVADSRGEFVAWGACNPRSKITLRLLEWDEGRAIDTGWWRGMIERSAARRGELFRSADTDAFRVVFGEADGLPGLIADYYAGYIVTQFLTAGALRIKSELIDILVQVLKPKGIYSRADNELLALEGVSDQSGAVFGESPPDDLIVRENGMKYYADLRSGQKTGFYADQRNNRRIVSGYARGKRVLDCFCYSGGFTMGCLAGGAESVVAADSSHEALELLGRNIGLNGFDPAKVRTVEADIFQLLRDYRDNGEKFDLVILDPPKFAPTKASLARAMRAYKDLNLHGIKSLAEGGILATFSCSGGVTARDLKMALAWAATDAGCEMQIIEYLTQAEDHPMRLAYPESEYLKGIIARKTG